MSCSGKWEWYDSIFLEGLLTLSNVYQKIKIFEIIESRNLRGNTDHPFGLKKFFSCINSPGRFLA